MGSGSREPGGTVGRSGWGGTPLHHLRHGGVLAELRDDLKAGRFVPLPVREKLIPKKGGKFRGLGIPTARDRTVQAALKLVLEPIFEADFQPCSYGFRPRRRAQDAIEEIFFYTTHSYEWVLEGDIKSCFDAPSHCPFCCWDLIQERDAGDIHPDPQAFSAPGANMDGLQLAALYTLQHRLARHAKGRESPPTCQRSQVECHRRSDSAAPRSCGCATARPV